MHQTLKNYSHLRRTDDVEQNGRKYQETFILK